jgi:hypothetical protein
MNKQKLPHCNEESGTGVKLSPYVNLSPESHQLPYNPKDAKALRGVNVHQGQRKLLMSEIQLLTLYYSKNTVHPWLVYVGSAPGTHLLFLHKMFPHVRFSLWDGAAFDARLQEVRFKDGTPVFEIHGEFFTDHTCRKILDRKLPIGKTPLLFVSDIRSGQATYEAFEARVMQDMLAQKRWVILLKPELSLLKFRLPFTLKEGDKVPYLDGKLYYGIWPPHESAETRLLLKKSDISKPEIQWDYATYERVMFHHNAVVRRMCFDITKAPVSEVAEFVLSDDKIHESQSLQYCRCYDCLSELCVFNTYYKEAAANAQAVEFSRGKLADLLIASHDRDMYKHGKIDYSDRGGIRAIAPEIPTNDHP